VEGSRSIDINERPSRPSAGIAAIIVLALPKVFLARLCLSIAGVVYAAYQVLNHEFFAASETLSSDLTNIATLRESRTISLSLRMNRVIAWWRYAKVQEHPDVEFFVGKDFWTLRIGAWIGNSERDVEEASKDFRCLVVQMQKVWDLRGWDVRSQGFTPFSEKETEASALSNRLPISQVSALVVGSISLAETLSIMNVQHVLADHPALSVSTL